MNLNFYFSYIREPPGVKFNIIMNPIIVFFTHLLSPGLKLYLKMKLKSSFFCQFFFAIMFKIVESRFLLTISYPYINPINRCITLKCDGCLNNGESAAGIGFSKQKKVNNRPPDETAAAGPLWVLVSEVSEVSWDDMNPSPITPSPHHSSFITHHSSFQYPHQPIFRKPLYPPKTRINIFITNHEYRSTHHARSWWLLSTKKSNGPEV